MKSSLKYIALALALLLLVAGAGGYYYAIYVPEKEAKQIMTSLNNSKPAIQALYTGQYDIAETNLRALIEQAPTKSEKARLQVILMATLFDTGKGNDAEEAASLAYTLVNDYSVPAWIRATAYNTLSRVVYAHTDTISFYTTYFDKAPFDSYLGTSGTDTDRMWSAYLKLLQVSDDIYPTSLAEYGIARYYVMFLSDNSLTQQKREEIATLMQKYVAEGDTRSDSAFVAPGATASLYAPYNIILNQLSRAEAIALSNKILQNHDLLESEQAYIQVKTVADGIESGGVDMNNSKIQAVLFTWRFTYAGFLLTEFGTVRTPDIQTLLAPFGTLTSQDIITFLKKAKIGSIQDIPSTSGRYIKTLKLAAISPEFRAFLVRTGAKL